MAPVVGILADLTNAGISTARGNYADAALSMSAAVPLAGTVAGLAKIAKSAKKIVKKAIHKIRPPKGVVKFGQGSVKNTFAHGSFKGRSISEVAKDLRSGKISPDDLPVEFVVRNGERIALNNRSLTALRRAGMQPTNLINKTGSKVHERLLKRVT